MAWQDLPKNQRLGILIAVPIVLAGVVGYFAREELKVLGKDPAVTKFAGWLYPKDSALRRSWYHKIKTKNDEIAAQNAIVARRPAAEADLAKVRSQQEWLQGKLPNQKQKTEMRVLLQSWAEELKELDEVGRIELEAVSIDERGSGGGGRNRGNNEQDAEEIIYRCRFDADMNGLIYYINRVESSTRFMALSRLTVTPGVPKVNSDTFEVEYPMHKVSMDIKTYVYLQGAE